MGRKVHEIDLVDVKQYLKDDHVRAVISKARITERVVGEVLGVCEIGGVVALLIEEWFVESDGWKTGAWREA